MANNMIKLGDVATYINGYAFKPKDRGKVGLPIIRIQDLTGNAYDLGFYDGEYPEKIEINDGDVLISWSAIIHLIRSLLCGNYSKFTGELTIIQQNIEKDR